MAMIGVIGAGHIGRSFSTAAIRAGHEIVISNNRGPESLADLISDLGPQARAATVAEAAAAGDFVVVAIPLPGTSEVPIEPLAGKVVIDTCNYFPERLGVVARLEDGSITVPGLLQEHLPTSRVVRAFNHIDAAAIATDGTPAGTTGRRALALAGDDPDARRLVADLYDQFGFDAVDIGTLDQSWRLDPGQPAFVVRQDAGQMRANVAAAKPQRAQAQQ